MAFFSYSQNLNIFIVWLAELKKLQENLEQTLWEQSSTSHGTT